MRRLVSTLAVAAAVVWSLIAWGAHALLGWVGGIAAGNADLVTDHPETVVWLSSLAGGLTGLGLFGIVAVWLLGLALIAIVAGLLRWLIGQRPQTARFR